MNAGFCKDGPTEACIPGCKQPFSCKPPAYWASPNLCTEKSRCSCLMPNGTEAPVCYISFH